MSESATILEYAVANEHLALIRDQTTAPDKFFRPTCAQSTSLIAGATRRLPSKTVNVTTPLGTTPVSGLRVDWSAYPFCGLDSSL